MKEEKEDGFLVYTIALIMGAVIYVPVWILEYYSPQNITYYRIALGINILGFLFNLICYTIVFSVPSLRNTKPSRPRFMHCMAVRISWALNGYLLMHGFIAIPVISVCNAVIFGACAALHKKISGAK